MKTYRIICIVDPNYASRYSGFSRSCEKTEATGLTFDEARRWMLDKSGELAGRHFANWGLAVIASMHRRGPECFTDIEGYRSIRSLARKWRMIQE